MPRRGPPFAEPDQLKLLVQSVLSDNLIKRKYRTDWTRNAAKRVPRFEGHCYAACEAYLFLKGGERSGLHPRQLTLEDDAGKWSHRWLETSDGQIIDLTIGIGDERKMWDYPYEDGRQLGFMPSKGAVSVRAQEIIDRVKRARRLRLT
jgi:hypothetical protein